MIPKNIFRAYDIRGIYGKTLTPEIMAKIGYLLGNKDEEIVVGIDIRSSGPELAKALISGLLAKGSKVYYSGTGTFGQIFFSGLGKSKTLFVTASHLTGDWNGLKLYYGDGTPFSGNQIKGIRDNIENVDDVLIDDNSFEKTIKIDSKNIYKDFIKKRFTLRKMKVVVDCKLGCACLVVPETLREMGMDVISINDKADPNFGNKTTEIEAQHVKELKERVVKEGADLGMAFDGDGDRIVIVDDKGKILTGNEIGVFLAKHYLEKRKGTIINTIACSMMGEKILKPLGGKIITFPVGHTHVSTGCKEHNALMGYEESGHIFLPEYFYFDDGFIVPLKVMEIMQSKGKKLSELIKEVLSYLFLEKPFVVSDDNKKFEIVKRLTDRLKKEYDNTNDMDGIKVIFDDGWILIRPANTNPKIRLYVEALTDERFKELEMKFTKILEEEIAR